jgi:hypothetical protein
MPDNLSLTVTRQLSRPVKTFETYETLNSGVLVKA